MGISTASGGVLYTESVLSVIRQRWWLERVVAVCHFTTLAASSSSFSYSPSHRRQHTTPTLLTSCSNLLWNWPQEIGPSSSTCTSLVKGCGQQPFINSREEYKCIAFLYYCRLQQAAAALFVAESVTGSPVWPHGDHLALLPFPQGSGHNI